MYIPWPDVPLIAFYALAERCESKELQPEALCVPCGDPPVAFKWGPVG